MTSWLSLPVSEGLNPHMGLFVGNAVIPIAWQLWNLSGYMAQELQDVVEKLDVVMLDNGKRSNASCKTIKLSILNTLTFNKYQSDLGMIFGEMNHGNSIT